MLDLDAIEEMLTMYRRDSTHYEDCWRSHPMCAAWAMLEELRKLSGGTTPSDLSQDSSPNFSQRPAQDKETDTKTEEGT